MDGKSEGGGNGGLRLGGGAVEEPGGITDERDDTEVGPRGPCLNRLDGAGDVGKGSSCEDTAAPSASRISSRVMSSNRNMRQG